MVAGLGTIQSILLIALGISVWYLYSRGEPSQWYDRLSERLLFGVPWGTLLSVVVVVAFYLVAQNGLSHWNSPVTMAFRSWSYGYVEGLLAAGFAHASPNHLIGNMVGTIVLAPIVEYAWSHYPLPRTTEKPAYEYPPPGEGSQETTELPPPENGLLQRPWVRALVVFPAVVIVVSLVTSILALGWSLGFSGTVFAFGGFAVIYYPLTAILAMVGFTGSSIIVSVLREPVLRVTAGSGTPGPPSWWGVNVQAHMIGFLLGVVLAVALLRHRNERRDPVRVFVAVLAFGLARQLWSFAISGGEDVYVQQRGIGVIFVIGITILIADLTRATDEPMPSIVPARLPFPDRRTLAYLWLGAVAVVALLGWVAIGGDVGWSGAGLFVLSLVILVIPSLPVVLPDRLVATPVSRRQALLFGLVGLTVFIAIPSYYTNASAMSDDPLSGEEAIEIDDYRITYAEEIPHGRISGNESGLIVVSERRDIWSTVVEKDRLRRQGEATAVVGGFGWRDTVEANRTGWELTSGEAAYAVDLRYDGERSRSFESDPVESETRITNRSISIVPDGEEFLIEVSRNETVLGEQPVPARNESSTVAGLEFRMELDDDTDSLFVHDNGTRVLIATRE